jgi:DNA-binding transcriptional ArsR family regulator
MLAVAVIGDPVRRLILELLADGERPAGDVGAVVQTEFRISQPAVSLHLRILREQGLVTVRAAGTRRLYAVNPAPFREMETWLQRYGGLRTNQSDAPSLGIVRGRKGRRVGADGGSLTVSKKKRKKGAKRKEHRP